MVQKFYRRREVEKLTGLPTSTLYQRMAEGSFPKPIELGPHSVAWLESDLSKWQADVLAANGREAA